MGQHARYLDDGQQASLREADASAHQRRLVRREVVDAVRELVHQLVGDLPPAVRYVC